MSVFSRVLLLVLLAAGLEGCTRDVAHRAALADQAWETCRNRDGKVIQDEQCCGDKSTQLRSYQAEDNGKVTGVGSYLAGYVEFDDQGWNHSADQRRKLFAAMEQYRQDNGLKDLLMVVYAHGWEHNAGQDDENVREFNKLLERLDLLEQRLAARGQAREARKVVGIYLGWRGKSIDIPVVQNMSFWTRKNSGERVGDGSVRQLLMELNEYRAYVNGWDNSYGLSGPDKTQLILIGHSFGGMLMYRALEASLMERAMRVEKGGANGYRYDMAKSFADFLLLVNPAFEGSIYEPLLQAARDRCYSDRQRPVMAIITSESDLATKIAFPLGRLYTFAQSVQNEGEREAVLNTVGHIPKFATHRLLHDDHAGTETKPKGLAPTSNSQVDLVLGTAAAKAEKPEANKPGRARYDGAVVEKISENGYPPHFPYLVMTADKRIIDGHSDIWNERFARFMLSFIATEVMKTGPKITDIQDPPEQQFRHRANCVPFGLDRLIPHRGRRETDG